MTVRRMTLAVLAFCLFTIVTTTAWADEVVVRFKGLNEGKTSTVIGGEMMPSGKLVTVPIPNEEMKDPKKPGTPTPKKDLYTAAKALKPGQIVKLGIENSKMGPVLTSVEVYDAKPGEETPNGYVFSKTFDKPVGKSTTTLLVLTKFGKEYQFTLPTVKGESGAPEQDPAVMAAIGKLQEGNAVWVQSLGTGSNLKLLAIEPYTEPKFGKLIKVGKTDVNGKEVPSADIEDDAGKAVTVLVPGKDNGKVWVPEATVNGKLHNVKPNTQISYRVHEDGDKLWLREIGPAPKDAAKPVEKEMAKDPKDAKAKAK